MAAEVIADEVARVWQRVLNLSREVERNAEFATFGGDSLLLLAIMTQLEEAYDVELDVEDFVADLTVNGMARTVAAAAAGR